MPVDAQALLVRSFITHERAFLTKDIFRSFVVRIIRVKQRVKQKLRFFQAAFDLFSFALIGIFAVHLSIIVVIENLEDESVDLFPTEVIELFQCDGTSDRDCKDMNTSNVNA